MNFVKLLKKELNPYHLLKHPFYQKWTEGTLPKKCLQNYAVQYYQHVSAFPRYISALHSLCENPKDRKILLENLNDEEGAKGKPHPDLWMYFAEGLGLDKEAVEKTPACKNLQKLIQSFFFHCRNSYAEGLSALYSYEYQVPEVAETKIQGLKKHYNITDEKTLLFFLVHKSADIEHRKALEELLEHLPEKQQKPALDSAINTAKALWSFLTEMESVPQAVTT